MRRAVRGWKQQHRGGSMTPFPFLGFPCHFMAILYMLRESWSSKSFVVAFPDFQKVAIAKRVLCPYSPGVYQFMFLWNMLKKLTACLVWVLPFVSLDICTLHNTNLGTLERGESKQWSTLWKRKAKNYDNFFPSSFFSSKFQLRSLLQYGVGGVYSTNNWNIFGPLLCDAKNLPTYVD